MLFIFSQQRKREGEGTGHKICKQRNLLLQHFLSSTGSMKVTHLDWNTIFCKLHICRVFEILYPWKIQWVFTLKLTYPIRVENKEIQLTRYCRSVWVCDRNRSFLSIYEEVWMVQGHHVLWWSFSRDKMLSSSCLDVPNKRFHLCVQKVLQSMKLGRCLLPCIACVQSFGKKKN